MAKTRQHLGEEARGPDDCVGEWAEWSACSVTCGAGTHERRIHVPEVHWAPTKKQ